MTPEKILSGLTVHVRSKLDALTETLAAKLDRESLCQLRDHLDWFDRCSEYIARQDGRIAAAVAGYEHQLRLLETVPGIDRASACAILAEIGPGPASVPAMSPKQRTTARPPCGSMYRSPRRRFIRTWW